MLVVLISSISKCLTVHQQGTLLPLTSFLIEQMWGPYNQDIVHK